jgi:ATP-dependent RNA helicase SUPV3L1/SUV3
MNKSTQHPHLEYYVFQNTAINHLFSDFEQWAAPKVADTQEQNIVRAKLKFLDHLISYTKEKLIHFPTLQTVFEDRFLPLEKMSHIDFIQHAVLSKEETLTNHDLFSLALPREIALDVLESYFEAIPNWWQSIIEDHEHTQKELRENFQEDLNFNESRCLCQECVHIFRTRLREAIFTKAKIKIEKAEEKLHDDVLVKPISDISYAVHVLRKDFDRMLHDLRFKFKRSSLNKLEVDLKGLFNRSFGQDSDLARVYKEKLKAYLNGVLVEENVGMQYLSEDDYEKFFKLIGHNLWRITSYLKKEFLRYIQSVLALKRKDISSTILREYLGQFWLHASARKINRKVTYHMGPTNSGKTYQAIQALCSAPKGCYLAPLRLLASELYDTMNQKGTVTTLLTGEEVIEKPGATHYSSTIEMAKLHEQFQCCVIDEIQMIADPQRGWAWTRALINIMSPEIHICGDGSVLGLVEAILKMTGDELEIKTYDRMTELVVEDRPLMMKDLKRGDAVIVFSRRNALKYKAELEKMNFKVSVIYGMLSPEVRREQARKFDEEQTDIIVSTDAIAMGMNLPVRRIVFTAFSKFIDNREIPLSMSEVKQISGRAGRYKRFPVGYVTCLHSEKNPDGNHMLRRAINGNLDAKTVAMVGPDLEIFKSVNKALEDNRLRQLDLSEFLRLFHTMVFQHPFTCVQLTEMIEITEMVERLNENHQTLHLSEVFGFACAPVNLGLVDHVQFFLAIVSKFVQGTPITNEPIDSRSSNIDYLETAIKCVELYQWLARHFDGKHFSFDLLKLLENKNDAIERLNELLSEKSTKYVFNMGDRFSFDREKKWAGKKNFKPSNPNQSGEKHKQMFKPGVPVSGNTNDVRKPKKWKNRKRQK